MDFIKSFFNQLHLQWSKSIYRQMAWSFSFVSMLIILSLGLALYLYERGEQYKQADQIAYDLARSVAYSSTSWVLANDLAGLQEVVQGVSQAKDIKFASVHALDGEVLASTRSEYVGHVFVDSISQRLLAQPIQQKMLLNNSELIDVAVPIKADL